MVGSACWGDRWPTWPGVQVGRQVESGLTVVHLPGPDSPPQREFKLRSDLSDNAQPAASAVGSLRPNLVNRFLAIARRAAWVRYDGLQRVSWRLQGDDRL